MCELLCSLIWEWVKNNQGFNIKNPERFKKLLDKLKADLNVTNCYKDELALKIAVCVVGPKTKEPPPEMMRHINELLLSSIPEQNERVQRSWEFAVAYGCGWQREIQKSPWGNRWPNAILEMERLVSIHIRSTLKSLAFANDHVRAFDKKIHNLNIVIQDMSRSIAMELYTNYGKYKLSEWEPKKGNLGSFIQFAVQGSTTNSRTKLRLKITAANLFSEGMLFEKFKEYNLLKKGEIEFKKCLEIFNEKICEKAFEGENCPNCKTPFNPKKSKRIKKRLLYLPTIYEKIKRKKCKEKECENYFPTEMENCPLCKGKSTQRVTHLLVHNPIFLQSLSQEQEYPSDDEQIEEDIY